MNLKKKNWLIGGAVFIAVVAACRQPTPPTPIAIPTPNLTLTALFEPTETIPPSVTPPAIQTATPMEVDVASPTPVPTQIAAATESVTKEAPTAGPTDAPTDGPTSTNTPIIAPDERTGPTVDAVFLENPPSIDGNIDEWALETYQLVAVVYGAQRHTGPEDLSGTFMVGWDDRQLYIAAQVKDDTYVQNAIGRDLFKGDSLEILFDKELPEDFFSTVLDDDDYQLGISPGAKIGDSPSAYLWYPDTNEGPRVLVNIAAVPTDDGYQVEMAVPWSVFGLVPAEGDVYGFGFSLSDNDIVGTSTQETMVSNVSIRNLRNPTTWGNLVLTQP